MAEQMYGAGLVNDLRDEISRQKEARTAADARADAAERATAKAVSEAERLAYDLDMLIELMANPPCANCRARREVHNTDELFSRHPFAVPDLVDLREWFIKVSGYTLPENR